MSRLMDKRILLTGASSGIGVATAERLAREGADLALVARGDGLAEAGRLVRSHGRKAHEIRADLGDRAELTRALTAALEALGGLDVAVLNASVATYGPFKEIPAEDFDRVVDVTFRSVVDSVRLLLPALEESSGTLVVTVSGGSKVPIPLMSAYVASKHAVRGFLDTLRVELAGEHSPVRVAMVHPGPVDTPFFMHAKASAGWAPAKIYGSYSAQTVARAIVGAAASPRREVTVGGAMMAFQTVYPLARPLLEPLIGIGSRAVSRSDGSEGHAGGLHEPSGDGTVGGGMLGRPSVVNELRMAPGRLARALLS